MRTGKPSIDRPWMKYYPAGIDQITVPPSTVTEYLHKNCPGMDTIALHYYGQDITWGEFFLSANRAARSLRALGFGVGDQIPVFLRAVPEFLYLLLAAEQIGASLLCRDNTLEENVEAVKESGAKAIFAHDFLTQQELSAYLSGSDTTRAVLLSPDCRGNLAAMPANIQRCIHAQYTGKPASGPAVLGWDAFLAMGDAYTGSVEAPRDIHRPLFRAYTSGSTGPSKQVIHSANSIVGIVHQMNLYAAPDGFRPTWLVACLPPSLVAVVVSMVLVPLASNKLLILDPFCDPEDVDLELMRYRPNCWPLIPMFIEIIMRSSRIPEDYDLSHLLYAGTGCEAVNNRQQKRIEKFLHDHGCKARFTAGYGSSEAGSSVSLPMAPPPLKTGTSAFPCP